jgi:hypothetical protein
MHTLSETVDRKFIEVLDVDEWDILTDDGWAPITSSNKTIKYEVFKVVTETNRELLCADNHILFTHEYKEVFAKDSLGLYLLTESGPEKVISVSNTGISEHMYDLSIDSDTHRYYTNGFLSHNTTIIAAYLLWFACFKFEKYILVASKDNDAAIDVMDRIRFSYELLPMWLKPGCVTWNRHEMTFDNNSTIKSSATTENTGRGRSISVLMLDELAFVKNTIQDAMWASLAPTLSTGGQCIISSTPNGDQDLFATLWRQAETETNGFKAVFAPWNAHPDRDESYKAKMIAKVGELMWRQEYECEFLSSEELLINSIKLNALQSKDPLFEEQGIKFWEHINPRKSYIVGVDISEGLGKDYSVIQIFDDNMMQVGEYRSNAISEAKLYDKIVALFKYMLSFKAQGKSPTISWSYENNSIGKVITTLYNSDANFPEAELISQGSKLGMNTNLQTKSEACKDLKRMVEQVNPLVINSKFVITELKNYIQKGSGKTYEAKKGSTDDTISAILICVRIYKVIASYDDKAFQKLYRGDEISIQEDLEDGSIEPMPVWL